MKVEILNGELDALTEWLRNPFPTGRDLAKAKDIVDRIVMRAQTQKLFEELQRAPTRDIQPKEPKR